MRQPGLVEKAERSLPMMIRRLRYLCADCISVGQGSPLHSRAVTVSVLNDVACLMR